MRRYSVEARKENMSKDMDFCNLQEFYPTDMGKLLDTATKTGLDAAKTVSKKLS